MNDDESYDQSVCNFLVKVASSHEELARFMTRPLDAIKDEGLSPNSLQILFSRDGQALQLLLGLKSASQSGGGGAPRKSDTGGRAPRKGAKKKAPAPKKKSSRRG